MKYDYTVDLESDSSLAQIIAHIKPNSKVIEFGPAKGYLTKILSDKMSCSVFCVEIDEEAANIAKQFSQEMIIGDIDSLRWKDSFESKAPFDFVIFADVLEHLRSPERVLEAAVELLAEEGSVICSIPNIAHSSVIIELLNGRFDYRETGLLDQTHIHFFTRKSIEELMDKCNLSVVDWSTTSILPTQTEIGADYSQVPEYVAQYLEQRKDAHVYQHIVVSRRKVRQQESTEISMNFGRINYRYFMQLFWGDPFAESRSQKSGLRLPRDNNIHRFFIPKEAIGTTIRVDPANFPSILILNRISYYDQAGNIIEEYSGDQLKDMLVPLHQIYQYPLNRLEDANVWLASGNDPEWLLDVPKFDCDNLIIEFIIDIYYADYMLVQKMLEPTVEFIGNYKNKLVTLEQDIKAKQNELDILSIQLTDSKNQLEQLQESYKKLEGSYEKLVSAYDDLHATYMAKEIQYNALEENAYKWKADSDYITSSLYWKLASKFRVLRQGQDHNSKKD